MDLRGAGRPDQAPDSRLSSDYQEAYGSGDCQGGTGCTLALAYAVFRSLTRTWSVRFIFTATACLVLRAALDVVYTFPAVCVCDDLPERKAITAARRGPLPLLI
jgi:hypothetical protein